MTYTTSDLAEQSGYTVSTLYTILHTHGFQPISRGRKGVTYWDDAALDYLLEHRCVVAGRVRTVGIGVLATQFHVTCAEVRVAATRVGVEPLYVHPKTKQEVYPLDIKDLLKEHFSVDHVDAGNEHPLVTDKNCLKLSWFPDINPNCFEDLDDD